MTVKRKRHFMKAITWRILATIATFFIAWIVTRKIEFGITIGIIDIVIKIALYYLHERMWYKSKYGVVPDKNKKL
jgi:uncharacterized membrane protein